MSAEYADDFDAEESPKLAATSGPADQRAPAPATQHMAAPADVTFLQTVPAIAPSVTTVESDSPIKQQEPQLTSSSSPSSSRAPAAAEKSKQDSAAPATAKENEIPVQLTVVAASKTTASLNPQDRFASPKPRGARTAPLNFVCPKCGSCLFGGARLQVASVMLPECDVCARLGYGEVFYSPPKINPEETRGMLVKKKNMRELKRAIEDKERRQIDHARAQLDAISEYVARSRKEKCARVHELEKQQQPKEKEKENEKEGGAGETGAAAIAGEKQPCSTAKRKTTTAADAAVAGRPPVFATSSVQFDSTTVSTTTVHGAALAGGSGDELRSVVESEASRLKVTPESLLAIPGFIDLKGRRLGIKRTTLEGSSRFELGFGFSATPLHFATLACRADLVAVLLDMGADPKASAGPSSIQVTNKALLAPSCIDLSKANKFDAITALLENAIASSPAAKFDAICQKKLRAAEARVKARRAKLEEREQQ